MGSIEVILPEFRPRRWQELIVERLRAAGYRVAIRHARVPRPWSPAIDLIFLLERLVLGRGRGTLSQAAPPIGVSRPPPNEGAVVLDLTGRSSNCATGTLRLLFEGDSSPSAAISKLAAGDLPDLMLVAVDRGLVARAAPMVDGRRLLVRDFDDVLARAVTLAIAGVGRLLAQPDLALQPLPAPAGSGAPTLMSYLFIRVPQLVRETIRRRRFRTAHWRVGYRTGVGPGVAETGHLGCGWIEIKDDGSRFLADPFAFTHNERQFIFVEDLDHALGKAAISVIEIDADGGAAEPRVVLEEAYHLSYPQVFRHGNDIFMLPEATAGLGLTLYRAAQFPFAWEAHKQLMTDCEIADATLLERGGRFWLFATQRDGFGSTSDTLVVYHASSLEGPWEPHGRNPILIDRTAARPGGAFVEVDGRWFLPIQDGTLGYGGGLGLSELIELSESEVRLSPPRPISGDGDWPHRRIHTLNRAGALEVIDGIAEVRR